MDSSHQHLLQVSRSLRRRASPRRIAAALLTAHTLLGLPFCLWPTPAGASAASLTDLPQTWRDDRGQSFELRTLQGHAVVLTMAYSTCHRVCPMTMRRLLQLQHDFDERGARVEFLVIGYDPDNDDAPAWQQYRERRHLTRSNWHFLVGTREDVEQIARQLGFDFWKYDQHVMHDARIVYFDERGTLVGTPGPTGLESTQR